MARRHTSPLSQLSAHWGLSKTARRFGVSSSTIQRWERKGLPQSRRREVEATIRRVDQARERAAVNDDWAREQLTRWVEAGNEESDAMTRLRELSRRKRMTRLDHIAIQTWQGLLTESRDYRRQLGEILKGRRFRNTPTGKQVGEITDRINVYGEAYRAASERDNAQEISKAWQSWERQVKRLAAELEGLQIPGMSQRQVYTLFFSP